MNVYDFDGTIYYPDCTISFALWCAVRHPKLWFTFAPKAIKNLIMYNNGKLERYKFERHFFSFLGMINDFDEQIVKFWDKHEKRISASRLKEESCKI